MMRAVSGACAVTALTCLLSGCVLQKYEVDANPQADAGPSPIVKSGKVDVLLMVDNSSSMADKQGLLSEVVPDLVQAIGSKARDVHYGVITSSLGGHGSDACTSTASATSVDMGHLIARNDPKNPGSKGETWQSKGFLFWDPQKTGSPAGEGDALELAGQLGKFVVGAGENGCGYEAVLEAWYRFLADPLPYGKIVAKACDESDTANLCREPDGIDDALLSQRADFLRPDSLVLVVMLTDENDCSVIEGGRNPWVLQNMTTGGVFHMPRGTSACASNPASPDCKPCGGVETASDPACKEGGILGDDEDPPSLRCYKQKQRFGMDFLYPVRRYVNALTKKRLTAEEAGWPAGGGKLTEWVNPLFCAKPSADWQTCEGGERDSSQVVLAGIVGVPWQDIARNPTNLSQGLLAAGELNWSWLVGDWQNYGEPVDPLMKETPTPRWGDNPATGEAIGSMQANSPKANSINGHEWGASAVADLQYACIFSIPNPRECAGAEVSCDCGVTGTNNPLCQADNGSYGTMQYRAKAYPSIRPLAVLQGLGDRAVVGSICASNTVNNSSADYAYRPVVNAIMDVIVPRVE